MKKVDYYKFFLSKYKKKLVLITKEIKKDYQKKPNNTIKITKKDSKGKQEISTENYLIKKKS